MAITPSGTKASVASQVFWNVEDVLQMARVALNDAQIDLSGDLFSDNQPYTLVYLNLAYANLLDELADSGVESVSVKQWVVTGLPASTAKDPAQQVSLGYDGYFDGTTQTKGPWTLPQDMLEPMELWERRSDFQGPYVPMKQYLGGFPSRYPQAGFGIWEFRENRIWMPAASVAMDLQIRGVPALPNLTIKSTNDNPVQVPLARSGQALAYMTAAEFAEARFPGQAGAINLRAKAQRQIDMMINKSVKRNQQTVIRRRPYGRGRWRNRGLC